MVHLDKQPLPEAQRYAFADSYPARLFLRPAQPSAKVIGIIGGGFTGVMTLANLLRFSEQPRRPLHFVLIERQPAIGEGIAYRTTDGQHLLNVPACQMSAWPDLPDDFVNFVRSEDPSLNGDEFLPRKLYGRYVRKTMLELAERAGDQISAEVVDGEVTSLSRSGSSGWNIGTAAGQVFQVDLSVVAAGHRPPNNPFTQGWLGPHTRFVGDAWASRSLSQIGPNESVLLIGSGLTAVDAILTLNRGRRNASLIALSRRGLIPLSHLRQRTRPADLSELAARLLEQETPLTIRQLFSALRRQVAAARDMGVDWRQVVDGLRPFTPDLWHRLGVSERSRFLTHVRPFWEVHRHRMPPPVADIIDRLRREKTLEVMAGDLISAQADAEGVDVTLSDRGASTTRTMRVSWVVNCTGPGVHDRHSTHPFLRPLLEAGTICNDELSLGLLTDASGRAINAGGNALPDLLIAGTLRKATLWESTAIRELRLQAQTVAQTALAALMASQVSTDPPALQPFLASTAS